MTHKLSIMLTTLALTSVLVFAVAGQGKNAKPANVNSSTQGISTRPPTKVMLPCKILTQEVGRSVIVTNTTSKSLPMNKVVYYNTKNVTKWFKSDVVEAGKDASYPLVNQASGPTCTAWVMQ